MRRTISIVLQNEAGALNRVAGLFSSRGYNIESLHVAPTQDPSVSRLTLVTAGEDDVIRQICNQLLKLVDVVDLIDMTDDDHFEREMMLVKLSLTDEQVSSVEEIVKDLGGRTLDDRPDIYTAEMTATSKQLDAFLERLGGQGTITAIVRSGAMAMMRGQPALGSDESS